MNGNTCETQRLIVRPTNEDDAAFIYELLNSPGWIQNIGDRNIRSENDALKYIQEKMLVQLKEKGFSNNTLIRKSDGMKIGTCGLYDRVGVDGLDIGFALLHEFWGQGYAFEAASRVMAMGIEQFQQKKISGITIPSNLASQKLLKKLGLEFRKMIHIPNDDTELMLFEYHC